MYRLPLTCPVPATATLPTPRQLAALGPVLCAYRGRLLDGWRAAVGATHGVCVDADGVCEYVLLRDAGGRVCWRLYLLPDSDFLAWERLAAALPDAARADVECPVGCAPDCGDRWPTTWWARRGARVCCVWRYARQVPCRRRC